MSSLDHRLTDGEPVSDDVLVFVAGDLVRICSGRHAGLCGRVTRVHPYFRHQYAVRIGDDTYEFVHRESELELIVRPGRADR